MKKAFARGLVVVCICAVAFFGVVWASRHAAYGSEDDPGATIALLVSDVPGLEAPLTRIWIDAAHEEGIRVRAITASDYLRPALFGSGHRYAGLILPDTVSQTVSGSLLERIRADVAQGTHLMLVYDAATRDMDGAYFPGKAPLSDIAGVDYALYDALRGDTTESGVVAGSEQTMKALAIPPGKSMPGKASPEGDALREIAGYQYGSLRYPSFATRGSFAGARLLMSASGGLAAGVRQAGKAKVLFVNLPLGYLKGQTDGLLLHSFLRYFAVSMLNMPTLSAAPRGVGGLIFNWHVDSNAALPAIKALDESGVLQEGPFSIHFTAGPDARRFGDHLGLDLEHNALLKQWIARFKQRGDALGDHGGWIHDYFGLNVSEDNQAEMEKFLVMNDRVVSALNGGPVREYSAPVGTQPKWVTAWLEAHGYLAYYFMGNGGLGPTRSYREGRLFTPKIWSFPVLTFGTVASFEEASDHDLSQDDMTKWLLDVTDYVADRGFIRTIYSHPPGFARYPETIKGWFQRTRALREAGHFRWYTMTEVAGFLDRREQARWRLLDAPDGISIEADHPQTLEGLAWSVPKERFGKPQIVAGTALIEEDKDAWRVVAGDARTLRMRCTFRGEK